MSKQFRLPDQAAFDALQSKLKPKAGVTIPKPEKKAARGRSGLEISLERQMLDAGLKFETEYRFLPDRKFRADFAFVEQKLLVEVDGMVHRIKARFKADIEKKALALLAGWRVLSVGGDQVRDGEALKWIKEALK